MHQLSIYRASAGSGKTFRLTIEYLKILLKNPTHYRNILAITFTNKATEEMKNRILEQLHLIASGKQNDYLNLLAEETQLSTRTIQQNATIAEKYILHDYNLFSVMTIDAFFQIVVKSFARELNLSHNYDIELEIETIKELALERLFAQLDKDIELRKWLRAFIENKIQDGKSWNITQDILHLSTELFSEKLYFLDRKLIEKWSNKQFMQTYINKFNNIIFSYKDKMKELATKAMIEIANNELCVSDFSYGKSGIAGFLQKLSEGIVEPQLSVRTLKILDDAESMYSKKTKLDTKERINSIYPFLRNIVLQLQQLIEEKKTDYTTSLNIKKNIHIIGIFSDLAKHIYALLQENNKMLLSESNKLLHGMIENNEAPFIYEKIGTRYSYFLWDEFQDTSQIQWDNLKPLLANSLSSGNPCLIVGDTKQAIYRWRNGDWNILQSQVQETFPNSEKLFLQKNWRSSHRVIDFNNNLYKILPQLLENQIECDDSTINSLYLDAHQEYGKDQQTNGSVTLSFATDTEETKAETIAIDKTVETIVSLQEQGVSPKDIVILVRKHKEAIQLTTHFMELDKKNYSKDIVLDVISDEALFLSSSITVRIIETALSYFHTQEQYYKVSLQHLLSYLPTPKAHTKKWFDYTEDCKHKIINLGELITTCINIFSLNKINGEQSFLLGFEEEVASFHSKNNGSLSTFLSWWKLRREKAVVATSEFANAIRIYTIHKSKGLEFDHVIIPFAEQTLEQHRQGENIWVSPTVAPFKTINKALLPYGKHLEDTIFNDEYREEKEKRYIDILNVLYVATTRAKTTLFMCFPLSKQTNSLGHILLQYIQSAAMENFWGKYRKEDTSDWQCGIFKNSKKESKESNEKILSIKEPIHNQSLLKSMTQLSTIFPVDKKTTELHTISPITEGNLWHKILQYVYTYKDIATVVERFHYKGLILSKEKKYYIKQLEELLSKKEISQYYTSAYTIYNECPILMNGEEYIPDRVVENTKHIIIIEYKFGKQESPKYNKQLLRYKNFFKQHKQKKTQAFLIYGLLNKIIEV